MCRWLAYSGTPLQPASLVLEAQNSIVAMSLNSPLGAQTVNGDGFGLGWYPADEPGHRHPTLFRSTDPAWHDENLREICRAVRSPLFFAHVRAALGPPIQRTNCHPFRYENWLFMHNGSVLDFTACKRDLVLAIDPTLYTHVLGTTDSEVLFHLALTYGLADDPIAAMAAMVRKVEEAGAAVGIPHPMHGTMAVSDGKTLWAFRYSSDGRSPTLFHSADMPVLRRMFPDFERFSLFADDARVIVSEPLNDLPGAFLEVPESTVVVVDREGYRYEQFLAA